MNIAILIPDLMGGGAQHAAKDIGNYYINRGNNVYYFVGDDERARYNVSGHLIFTKIKLKRINRETKFERICDLICSASTIRKLKKKYDIDYTISFMEECNYLNILSRYRDVVIIRVCTIITYRNELMNGYYYDKKRMHRVYSKADHIVVMSKDGKKELEEYFSLPESKIHIIPNMVIKEVRGLSEETNEKTLIAINRIDPVKQYGRMIRSFYYAHKKDKMIKLIILGEGECEDLKNLCKKFEIADSVIFEGYKSNIGDYIVKSRCFIITSKCEGFSYSTIEAMNYGLPVICSDSPGGIRDIIESGDKHPVDTYEVCKYGILTPRFRNDVISPELPLSKEERILGEAILEIMNNDLLYSNLRNASIKRAELYTENDVMKKWDNMVNIMGRKHSLLKRVQSKFFCAGAPLINKQRKERQELIAEADLLRRQNSIYAKWIARKQKDNNGISEYLLQNGYHTVAVYGLGQIGKMLIRELSGTEIEVKYAIDRNAEKILSDITVYSLEDKFETVDLIIVTIPNGFHRIKETLRNRTSIEIRSIEDIICEFLG